MTMLIKTILGCEGFSNSSLCPLFLGELAERADLFDSCRRKPSGSGRIGSWLFSGEPSSCEPQVSPSS